MVYLFEDTFKREASDMEDLIDGLLYIDARSYMREDEARKHDRSKQ